MFRIRTIAGVAYKEALRNKIFLSLVLFLVIIVFYVFSMPVVEKNAQGDLIELVTITATLVFTNLIAIFLSSLGLPAEIKDKRIMTILCKPIHRYQILLGRILGLSLVMASLLVSMWLITLVCVQFASAGKRQANYVAAATETNYQLPKNAMSFGAETGRYWLSSWDPKFGIEYKFSGLSANDFDETIHAELFYITQTLNHWDIQFEDQKAEVHINGSREILIEASLIDKRGSFNLDFPADVLRPDGSVDITIKRAEQSMMIGIRTPETITQKQGLRLYGKNSSYAVNLFKAFLLIFFANVLFITLGVSASTFLSGPVAIVLGLALLIGGSILDYVDDSLDFLAGRIVPTETARRGEHDEQGKYAAQEELGHNNSNDPVENVIQSNPEILRIARTLTTIIPNISHNNPLPWLKQQYHIQRSALVYAAGYVFIYMLLFFSIGYAAFRRIEIQ